MPESALWSLIVALIMLALGLALKVAQLMHRLDDVNKKSASSDTELKSLQNKKDEEISNIKKLYDARINELSDTISNLKAESAKNKPKATHKNSLDAPKIKILIYLSSQKQYIETDFVAAAVKLSHQIALFHLEELSNQHMVSRILGLGSVPTSWTLTHEGRRYLIDNNLI